MSHTILMTSLFRMTDEQISSIPEKVFKATRSSRHESCHVCLVDFANNENVIIRAREAGAKQPLAAVFFSGVRWLEGG